MKWVNCLILMAAHACAGSGAACAAPQPTYGPVRFLTSGHTDLWPSFSPDGTHILFTRNDQQIPVFWLVSVIEGRAQRFGSPSLSVGATRGNWSGKIDRIAFTGIAADRNEVWLIEPDGSNAHRVNASGLSDQAFYPSWYPDGSEIAVMDARDLVIKRIDLKLGSAVALTQHAQVLTGMPSVSPDGKLIAFAGQANQGTPYDQTKNSIWIADDTAVSRPLESTPMQGRAPAWSPDGKRLAFESNRGSAIGLYAIFIIDKNGTGLMQITDPSFNADHPVWSPDGRSLAFCAHPPLSLQGERGIALIQLPGAHQSSK